MTPTRSLSTRRRLLAVLCGGFAGTLVRYGLSLAIEDWLGKSWPYDILLLNLSGALLLAFLTVLADVSLLLGPTRRLLLTTGFLGAYTTFSSLALGEVLLLSKAEWLPALLYLALSLPGGIGAVLLGDWLGQRFIAHFRRNPAPAHLSEPQPEKTPVRPPDLFSSPRSSE